MPLSVVLKVWMPLRTALAPTCPACARSGNAQGSLSSWAKYRHAVVVDAKMSHPIQRTIVEMAVTIYAYLLDSVCMNNTDSGSVAFMYVHVRDVANVDNSYAANFVDDVNALAAVTDSVNAVSKNGTISDATSEDYLGGYLGLGRQARGACPGGAGGALELR